MNYYLQKKSLKKHLQDGLDVRFEGCDTEKKLRGMINRAKLCKFKCEEIVEGNLYLIRMDDESLKTFLLQLKSEGLCGIEGYYNEYTPEMQDYFQSLAKELGLEISGGTDYHAKMKPHIEIGIGQSDMAIPYSVLENIKRIVNQKFGKNL